MKTYNVIVIETVEYSYTVEADDERYAEILAGEIHLWGENAYHDINVIARSCIAEEKEEGSK